MKVRIKKSENDKNNKPTSKKIEVKPETQKSKPKTQHPDRENQSMGEWNLDFLL